MNPEIQKPRVASTQISPLAHAVIAKNLIGRSIADLAAIAEKLNNRLPREEALRTAIAEALIRLSQAEKHLERLEALGL